MEDGEILFFFFFQAEDGIRDADVTGVQTCALPISRAEISGTDAGQGGWAARSRDGRREDWRRRGGRSMRYADTRPARTIRPGDGRLAQRESASFTPRRSLVRSQYRPPEFVQVSPGVRRGFRISC